jgi:putative oxidoreductase
MTAQGLPLLVARILLALMFLLAGLEKLSSPAGTAGWIAGVGLPMPMVLTIASGLLEVVAGTLLVIGWQARWAALALAIFTVAANLLFHNYWGMTGEPRMINELMFLKNTAVVGGLLCVFAFGPGSVSLDARKAAA